MDLARRELVHDERDRAVAGDVGGGAEGVDHDVGRDHEREHRVVEAQVGLQQAGSRHDGAARHARGRDHHDAQQEDEAEDLAARDVQAGHVHDGQRVEHDLHHRTGQLDGGAKRDHEAGDVLVHVVFQRGLIGDRDARGGRRGAQGGEVRRQHVLQGLERVHARDRAGNQVLHQHDGHGHDHGQQQHHTHGGHGVAEVLVHAQAQEGAEDVQRQQRNHERDHDLEHDVVELLQHVVQVVRLHRRHGQAHHEREQQRGHNRQRRRHLHGEVGGQATLVRVGHVGNQVPAGQQLRVQRGAGAPGDQAGDDGGAEGHARGDAQPLAGAAAQARDGGRDEREDQHRDEEAEEVGEQSVEGDKDASKPVREEQAAQEPEDDGDNYPEE